MKACTCTCAAHTLCKDPLKCTAARGGTDPDSVIETAYEDALHQPEAWVVVHDLAR